MRAVSSTTGGSGSWGSTGGGSGDDEQYVPALVKVYDQLDGVSRAKLKLGPRTIVARIRTDRTNTAGLTDAVRAALDERLDQVIPLTRPAMKIRLHATRNTP